MQTSASIASKLAESAAGASNYQILQDLEIGKEGWENELLLFMKPELFIVPGPDAVRQSAGLVLQKLAEYQVELHGLMIVGGKFLADQRIMDRHYGYINQLSKNASRVLSVEDRAKVAAGLGLPSTAGIDLFGGHEYLAAHPGESIDGLDQIWFSKKSIKIRSGFYVQLYEANGRPFILVNGFHPAQLNHFTHPDHRTALFLLHSNTAWKSLRNDMVGNTYPEKAAPDSIRGSFFANPARFGQPKVDISVNGVHLSAGPYEGVFEVLNFFSSLYSDANRPLPLLAKRLVAAGLPISEALAVRNNPPLTIAGKATDLFSATEDLDTGPAIEFWQKNK